jgi:hypothetical protein
MAIIAFTGVACGGGDGPSSPVQPSPIPSPGPTSPAPPLQPTFSSIRTQVLDARCITCHSGVGRVPDGGLRLEAAVAYQQLVNAQSEGKPSAVRVVPGDPNASYLIHKLEGRFDIVGARMPLGDAPLAQADIDVIRTWISQGAANN